ncbi:MAG: replicative DNA helicase [Clostridia bacterium]|nr:replicative DNA helicase [Clostridia bacterium]
MPHSLEAEQSVLGSILIDPERFGDIMGIIQSTDFYLKEHREIYLAMQKLFLQSRTIDLVTLIDTLVSSGVYNKNDSVAYMKVIAEIVPSAANIVDYAKIVRDKSLLRRLISACDEINSAAYEQKDSAGTIVDMAGGKILGLAEENAKGDFTHIRDVLIDTYAQLDEIIKNKGEALGTPSGFGEVDRLLVGFGKGDLVLVGARPGMGKTSYALNLATNVARSSGKAVCIFSLEMSKSQLVSRMLSSEALVDSYAMRTGKLDKEQWARLAKASAYLSECDIYIDDTSGVSVAGMKAKLRRVKNLGMVVIDYLGLMQSDKHSDNRVQEVSEISRNLKILAKDLGIPIICCAQLNRGSESRNDKRPMLSDLRDSGAIEQDADVIMFLSRDYYNTDPEKQNVADVIIAKNRHGSIGTAKLGWFGKYTKFASIDDVEES